MGTTHPCCRKLLVSIPQVVIMCFVAYCLILRAFLCISGQLHAAVSYKSNLHSLYLYIKSVMCLRTGNEKIVCMSSV